MPFLAWPVIWSFLKTWWKVIVPVVLLLMALGYVKILHMEIDHYKSEVIALKEEKAAVAHTNDLLTQAATDISKQYFKQLENRLLEQQKQFKQAQERIKNDKETARIVLSANTVELFNATKPDSGPTPTAERKDDAKASTNSTTLNMLLQVSAINDENHNTCIETVAEWQNFWRSYKSKVEAIVTP